MAIVRCRQGGLFETKWVPLVSFTSVRLGSRRWQRCPVHHHWDLVEKVDPSTLTDEQRSAAAEHPAGRIP